MNLSALLHGIIDVAGILGISWLFASLYDAWKWRNDAEGKMRHDLRRHEEAAESIRFDLECSEEADNMVAEKPEADAAR